LGVGDELERAAELADKIADQPPRAPSGRHDDWCHGWQDGAMEIAAAIREMIEARHRTPSDLPQSAETLKDARTLAGDRCEPPLGTRAGTICVLRNDLTPIPTLVWTWNKFCEWHRPGTAMTPETAHNDGWRFVRVADGTGK
jgi:hypothetical protein